MIVFLMPSEQIFQLYHGENKLHFNVGSVQDQHAL